MGKTRRKRKDNYDPEKEERLLEQIKLQGRKKTPPPGHFHSPKKLAANRRNDRRDEKKDLKNYMEDYNHGD